MSTPTSRREAIFFEVYESLPRQGPGNRACAERALALCADLPAAPRVLDLGCGTGGQTLLLAELTAGSIVAVDCHAPSITRLQTTLRERGLGGRVEARVGDMTHPGEREESVDLIWSEGALYNVGIGPALGLSHRLLREGGYLVFTDAVWRRDDPPADVRAAFDADYPAMGHEADVLAIIDQSALALVDHFTLPDEAWWDDFYAPMQRRTEELRGRYRDDPEALAALEAIAREPAMHREHGDCYDYELFVLRKA